MESDVKKIEEQLKIAQKEKQKKMHEKKAISVRKKLSIKDIAAMAAWEGDETPAEYQER